MEPYIHNIHGSVAVVWPAQRRQRTVAHVNKCWMVGGLLDTQKVPELINPNFDIFPREYSVSISSSRLFNTFSKQRSIHICILDEK